MVGKALIKMTKRYTLSRTFLATLFALVVSGGFLRAQTPEMEDEDIGELFDTVLVPAGMTKEEIRDTLADTFLRREWTVQQKTDRRVIGYIKHGGNEAITTMIFGGESVKIYCKGWEIDRRGERRRPEVPKRWLAYLRKDLDKRFAVFSATR